MRSARPLRQGTGAVVQPGSRIHGTASTDLRPADGDCRRLHVELYRNTARLFGGQVRPLLDLAGVDARMYDRALGCWTVPMARADDVMVVAEYQQRRFVTVAEVDR